jgi:hypothetical protein
LAGSRRRFGAQFARILAYVLQVARDSQLARFDAGSVDGAKNHAIDARDSALPDGFAEQHEWTLVRLAWDLEHMAVLRLNCS